MHQCVNCGHRVEALRLNCPACRLTYEGRFLLPRLARLEPQHQSLVETLILAMGNLKLAAADLGISYPTLRKRLDGLVANLEALRRADSAEADTLLAEVESRQRPAEEAARLIKEMNGAP
jgi:hypothetical protein